MTSRKKREGSGKWQCNSSTPLNVPLWRVWRFPGCVQAPKRGPKGREPAPAPAAASSGKAKKVRAGEKESNCRETQNSGRRQRLRGRGSQAYRCRPQLAALAAGREVVPCSGPDRAPPLCVCRRRRAREPALREAPKQFGIGGALRPKKDLHRFVKWPKYVRLQRQKRILSQRLKVPPAINQFTQVPGQEPGLLALQAAPQEPA